MLFRSSVLIALVAIATVASFAQKTDDAFKTLVNQFTTAQTTYDGAALDKLVTSDYIEVSPLGEVDPRDKFLSFYSPEAKAAAGNIKASVETTDFSIRDHGKYAIVIVRLNYIVSSEGKTLPPRSIRATYVMQKEKNAWKVASAQYTGIRTPAPPK